MPGFLLASGSNDVAVPLSMLIVLASAKLLAELLERLRLPGIVGEILAGIVIGPHVLGWLAPNQVLEVLAELGVMFLLFRVGLEVKPSDLLRVGGTALLVAVAGMALPFFAGWGISALWGEPQLESIFIGAAMVATSVGITAEVLASGGFLSARASKIIMAAAVIDDVLGLIVLALVSSLARGRVNFVELGVTAAVAIGFTVVVARWGTETMHRVVPRVQARLRLADAQFALSMILLFALAALAIYAGVAAIVGAFLAGMALSESVEQRVRELTSGVTYLLVPFFLVGIGLHFDPTAFAVRSTLMLALLIFIAALASKFIGCGLGALAMGRRDAVRVGVGMVPRGEVGMVVAQIGLSIGVMAPHVFSVIVFMAVATTVVAPPLIRLAYRDLLQTPPPAETTMHLG